MLSATFFWPTNSAKLRRQRAARGRKRDLVAQLEREALGELAAHALDLPQARDVAARYGAHELLGRQAREDRERDARPDALDVEQRLEEAALVGVGEAVETQGLVLDEVRVNVELHLASERHGRQHAEGGLAHEHVVADARDLDDDGLARVLHELAAP